MTLTTEELQQYSPSVRRTLGLPRPKWRGVMHRWAFWISIPIGIVATVLATSWPDRLGVGAFAIGITTMFGVSMRAHRDIADPKYLERLFAYDHSAIYLCIATGATAVGMLGLEGQNRLILIGAYWAGCLFGLATVWAPFHPPRGMTNLLYLAIGWTAIPMWGPLREGMGDLGLGLLLFGAAWYSIGALIVGSQRPNPNPHVFGYHEIWHVFVIIGASVHWVMVGIVLAH